jgi:hypothetical protein
MYMFSYVIVSPERRPSRDGSAEMISPDVSLAYSVQSRYETRFEYEPAKMPCPQW